MKAALYNGLVLDKGIQEDSGAAIFHRTMKAALYNGLVLDIGIQEDNGTETDCGKRFFVIIKETKTTDHTMSGKDQ
jgi:hypothetical protein